MIIENDLADRSNELFAVSSGELDGLLACPFHILDRDAYLLPPKVNFHNGIEHCGVPAEADSTAG